MTDGPDDKGRGQTIIGANRHQQTRRGLIKAGIVAAPLVLTSCASAAALGGDGAGSDGVVQTSHGPVSGYRDGPVHVFKGVRYGADTAGTRFAKPKPPTPWSQVQRATDYGPASPQRGDRHQDEDCLFVNIWTPGLEREARRPVMFYIHGGAYNGGSGSSELYDGRRLAESGDVVVITVNHRLNAFGYLSLGMLMGEAYPDSGNAGQWDLILALEWVKANAASFGGDPDRLMVFGQSGGGAKIATMMASPAAKGLFHSAATMSGQQVTACGPLNARSRALAYLDKLGVQPGDADALRSMPVERMIAALDARDPINPEHGLYFGPVLDERMLTRHPFWPDAPSQSAAIPMVLGNTRDETRNLIGRREPDAFDMTWDDLPARVGHHIRCDILPDHVVATYRAAYPHYSPADIFFAATTAGRSWRGQVEEADARARDGGPTWVYQFDWPSPDDGGKWGAPHTIDIAAAFGNLDKPGAFMGADASARRVSDQLQAAFINLARHGDPNHAGLPPWQKHRLPDRATMVFDATTQLVNDPRKIERELFAKVPFTQWGT